MPCLVECMSDFRIFRIRSHLDGCAADDLGTVSATPEIGIVRVGMTYDVLHRYRARNTMEDITNCRAQGDDR